MKFLCCPPGFTSPTDRPQPAKRRNQWSDSFETLSRGLSFGKSPEIKGGGNIFLSFAFEIGCGAYL